MGITFVDFLASNKAAKVSPLQYMHGYNIAECMGYTADHHAYKRCPERMFVQLSFTATICED